jgi:hypothetical protein
MGYFLFIVFLKSFLHEKEKPTKRIKQLFPFHYSYCVRNRQLGSALTFKASRRQEMEMKGQERQKKVIKSKNTVSTTQMITAIDFKTSFSCTEVSTVSTMRPQNC